MNIYIFINNNNYSIELKNTIVNWLDYKLERNEQYQEQGFKSLLTQIKNNVTKYGESKIIDIVNTSMASNYKGIIFDKLKKENYQSYQSKRIAEQQKAGEEFLSGEHND